MNVTPDLVAAYRAALYEVDATAETGVTFHIDEPCAALDRVLDAHDAAKAVMLTAYNPRSRKLTAAENTDAHRALLEAVAHMKKSYLPSRGRDPQGDWPAEPGLFILDASREDGFTLARRFDQYAFVWIERGRPPALVLAA